MSNFILQEIGEDEHFDPVVLCPNASFTQSEFYGEWQRKLGRTVKRFLVYDGDEVIAYLQMVKYPLLFGKSYFYSPYGPVVKKYSKDFLASLNDQLLKIAKKEGVSFVRLDFTPTNKDFPEDFGKIFTKSLLCTYHSANFQPRAEWFLSLNKPENELLKDMHHKARYSIGLSERKGVSSEVIRENFARYFDDFYRLMEGTAKRNGFHLHNKNYYKSVFESLGENAYLSVAKYKGKILAIDLVIVFGGTANYVFGGSSDADRNLMPTYSAQWKAICYAKEIGCKDYNFGGVESGNVYKGWGGLTVFKQKFGGRQVDHSPFYDIVSQPFWYFLYNVRKIFKKGSL
ncbi:MAG: peptidoglycan bridge formation glycyltransferase FemA/FemB family protein [Patescibacteria group bacterium]